MRAHEKYFDFLTQEEENTERRRAYEFNILLNTSQDANCQKARNIPKHLFLKFVVMSRNSFLIKHYFGDCKDGVKPISCLKNHRYWYYYIPLYSRFNQ